MSTGFPAVVMTKVDGASRIASGSVDATGAQILAADPYRKWGVLVQNVDATETLKIGTVTADALLLAAPIGSAVNTPNTIFIPGTGPVFGKSSNGTLTADYVLLYY